ncbi:unnamed protein product, partial [Schistosoma turkestanicum]
MQFCGTHIVSEFGRIVYGFLTVLLAMAGDIFSSKRKDYRYISKQRALDELRAIRESGLREYEKVVSLWKLSLCNHIDKLGYE